MADGKITGTLIYNEGWESGPLAGPGYFVALKFSSEDWADYDSIMVGVDPSIGTGLVEVKNNPDKNGVFKVSDKDTQKFIVQSRVGSTTTRTQYDLSELILQEPAPVVEPKLLKVTDPSVVVSSPTTVGDCQEDVTLTATETENYFDINGKMLNVEFGGANYRLYLDANVTLGTRNLYFVQNGKEKVAEMADSGAIFNYDFSTQRITVRVIDLAKFKQFARVFDFYIKCDGTVDGKTVTEKYNLKPIAASTT